jgi:hypothetical protein
MFRKLCAVSLLVLALSPFTAPFQTCDLADTSGTDEPVMLTPPTVAHTSLSGDAGSLVPTLKTETGRLRLAPASGLVISNVVAPPPTVFLRLPIPSSSPINGYSVLLSILRL